MLDLWWWWMQNYPKFPIYITSLLYLSVQFDFLPWLPISPSQAVSNVIWVINMHRQLSLYWKKLISYKLLTVFGLLKISSLHNHKSSWPFAQKQECWLRLTPVFFPPQSRPPNCFKMAMTEWECEGKAAWCVAAVQGRVRSGQVSLVAYLYRSISFLITLLMTQPSLSCFACKMKYYLLA